MRIEMQLRAGAWISLSASLLAAAACGGDSAAAGPGGAVTGQQPPAVGGTGSPAASGGNGDAPGAGAGGATMLGTAGQAAGSGSSSPAGSNAPAQTGAATSGSAAGTGASAGTGMSAGSGVAMAGAGAAGSGGGLTGLPTVIDTNGRGPFETTQDLSGGPAGMSGVFRPIELGQGGIKHPIFIWGCGGGSTPTTYADLMDQIASHGFVVIAETSQINDDGAPLKAAIDWMIAEAARKDSPFFDKLDTAKIGIGGHSIGSANSFLVASDPRLTTSIHVAGGSLDMAGDINAMTTGSGGKTLVHPVAYICSEMDQFGNVEKTEKDYANTTAPVWMTVMSGVDHVAAARQGMPAIIAWLRWHLAGEAQRRADFLDAMGRFNTGKWVSKNKNW